MDSTAAELINNVYVQGGIVMLVVNGAISVLKKWIPTKFLPLIALALPAIAGTVYAVTQHLPIVEVLIKGLVIGASSMGAYDVISKATSKTE